jgi:hypothetical protein
MARLTLLLSLLAALVVPSVAGAATTSKAPRAKLAAFSSCNDLIRYARRNATTPYVRGWRWNRRGYAPMALTGPPPPPPVGPDGQPMPMQLVLGERVGGTPTNSSTTNNQEAAVDEADIVKNDGRNIYALVGRKLLAVDARTGDPQIIGSLDLPAAGSGLFIEGDRALVIGQEYDTQAETVLIEVDLSRPADMHVLRTQVVNGSYVSARQTGSTARIVITSPPRTFAYGERSLRARVSGWLPMTVTRGAHGSRHSTAPHLATPCRRVRRASVFSGLDVLTVLTVDMSWGLPAVDSDSVMTDADTVYASPTSLYVTSDRWTAPDTNRPPAVEQTAIHRFDISKAGETAYAASGSVAGELLNQFSLSEYDGHLRVATTTAPMVPDTAIPQASQSYVSVLEQHGDQLVTVGRVGGLGEGERIYAVRFIGDRGYVVTFRQTDPLYTLDLSDPTAPAVRGEIKMRGYSAYLHPIGDDLLLGVGQAATEFGRRQGTQLSVFDVSDPANPRRLQALHLPDSYSDAEDDHLAFLWWPQSKLAVMPQTIWSAQVGELGFQGAIGYRVGRQGIEEVGRASHTSADYAWLGGVRRSVVVDGRLFLISNLGVQAARLSDLSEEGWVAIP